MKSHGLNFEHHEIGATLRAKLGGHDRAHPRSSARILIRW